MDDGSWDMVVHKPYENAKIQSTDLFWDSNLYLLLRPCGIENPMVSSLVASFLMVGLF
jgi:hypothetical protein